MTDGIDLHRERGDGLVGRLNEAVIGDMRRLEPVPAQHLCDDR